MRVRGLKPYVEDNAAYGVKSHPMRVRGLKPDILQACAKGQQSHPMRVRGLKPNRHGKIYDLSVAPHAGAWIETFLCLE